MDAHKGNPVVMATTGVAFYRVGRFDDAVALLDQVMPLYGLASLAAPTRQYEIRVNQLFSSTFLAMAYHDLGKTDKLNAAVAGIERQIAELEKLEIPSTGSMRPWVGRLSVTLARRELEKLKPAVTAEPAGEGR